MKKLLLIGLYYACFHVFAQKSKDIELFLKKNAIQTKDDSYIGLIVQNIANCNSCDVPISTIIDYLQDRNIKVYLIVNDDYNIPFIQLYVKQNGIDTNSVEILSDSEFCKKVWGNNTSDPVLMLLKGKKCVFKSTFNKIDYTKLDRQLSLKTNLLEFEIIKLNNNYHNNLFEACNYVFYNQRHILGILSSIGYLFYYQLGTSYIKERIVSWDKYDYLNLCKKMLNKNARLTNESIIENELKLKKGNVYPVNMAYSFTLNEQFLIYTLDYYSDTVFYNKPAILSNEIAFLIKYDTLLNAKDTITFHQNNYIIPYAGAYAFNDSIFYFMRYSLDLKRYVLSKFKLKDSKLFLEQDMFIPYKNKDVSHSVPRLKPISKDELVLFFYPRRMGKKGTKIMKFNLLENKVSMGLFNKDSFISYAMFYKINDHEYVFLSNKNNRLRIRKYNSQLSKYQTLLNISKDLISDKNVKSDIKLNHPTSSDLNFFLPNNTIIQTYIK